MVFFLANIVAHAATVSSFPGDTVMDGMESVLVALFLPYFGIGRALGIIRRAALFVGSPLQQARCAGAICVIGRTRKWRASEGPVIGPGGEHWFFSDMELEDGTLLDS